MKIILSILFVFVGVSSAQAACVEGSVRKNAAGVAYVCDTSNKLLGEAYRIPSGTVWGEAAKEKDGTLKYMNLSNAHHYCKSIGAELPSRDDYYEMLNSLKDSYFLKGTKKDVIPDLAISKWFWTMTSASGSAAFPLPDTPDSVRDIAVGPNQNHIVAINGPKGHYPFIVLYQTHDSGAHVRCISKQ